MNKILEMRSHRAELWDKAKDFLNTHQDEHGMLSAEDTATYERMEKEIADYGRAIEREERAADMERQLNAPTSAPITNRPDKSVSGVNGRASDEYSKAFWGAMRNRNGNAIFHDALQIGTDSEGGYLVPDEYERRLVKALEDENVMRNLCTIIRTESGERKIPLVASHGTASWVDEEGSIPDSDDAFGQLTIGAHKLATMIKVSDELLQDSVFDVESYIASEFARRIGAAEEEAFITGNGSAKPTGLLHATLGASAGVTTASSTTMTGEELIDLEHSVRAVYRRNSVFLMNDSTIKALRKLKDGEGRFLWEPGLKEGAPDMLLGHRIVTSNFMPEIAASAKTILFGDFSKYWIADREGRSFQRLNELYAATGQVGFRATQRVDGRLILAEAIKCLQMKT